MSVVAAHTPSHHRLEALLRCFSQRQPGASPLGSIIVCLLRTPNPRFHLATQTHGWQNKHYHASSIPPFHAALHTLLPMAPFIITSPPSPPSSPHPTRHTLGCCASPIRAPLLLLLVPGALHGLLTKPVRCCERACKCEANGNEAVVGGCWR